MKNKKIQKLILYPMAIGISIFLLFFIVSTAWIGYEVKSNCQQAQREYGGDCVDALSALLKDEGRGFRIRNSATWTLGQLGDSRALTVMKSFYTGDIPARESLDKTISQYELKKAINLANGGFNLGALVWRWGMNPARVLLKEIIEETVVISQPSDPYFPLAQKIAETDHLKIFDTIAEAIKFNPKFVILVASPTNLNEEFLLNTGNLFKNLNYYPAMGIITGSTIDKAEQLWLRRNLVMDGKKYLGTDIENGQLIHAPAIYDISQTGGNKTELNKANLIAALQNADYFYWARHVSKTKWFWNSDLETYGENDQITAKDLPELRPVIIYTPSCDSFQPWVENSIAIGFIDNGAAAYVGDMHSPVSNAFLMRKGLSVPGALAWKDVPVGIIAQIQNKMLAKTAHRTPQFLMLGDPRVFLLKEKPYSVLSDINDGYGNRTIIGKSDQIGILPLKIEGGADYDFLTIKNLASAGEKDVFYNNKIHTLNLGAEKYILFFHQGGDFTITLSKNQPVLWVFGDAILDALDFSWTTIGVVYESNLIAIGLVVLFIVILLFKIFFQKKPFRGYLGIFLIGVVIASIRLTYLLIRIDDYSISANLVDFSVPNVILGVIAIFASTSAGLILMKESKKVVVKILGLCLAVSPQIILTGFYFGFITLMNAMYLQNNPVPISLWNYHAFWLPFVVLLIEILIILVINKYGISERRVTSR